MKRLSINLLTETLLHAPSALAGLVCCNHQMRDRFQSQISALQRMMEEIWPEIPNIRNLGLDEILQEIRYHSSDTCLIPLFDYQGQFWRLFRPNEADSIEWIRFEKECTIGAQYVFLSPIDVFFFGGQGKKQKFYRTTYKASILQSKYEKRRPLINARVYCGASKLRSKVFVFGGYPQTSWRAAEVYDSQQNNWELLPQPPYACKNAQSGVFKDLIYTPESQLFDVSNHFYTFR